MRKIVLIFLLYLSIIKITYAIPIPALVVGWDFVVLAIPAILGIFSVIYFYFRKYVFGINFYLFILGVFLYLYHFDLTNEIFLYEKEYLLFLIFIILFGLIYKFKKLSILNYILVIVLIGINFFLIKLDSNLFKYNIYCNRALNREFHNFMFRGCSYSDEKVIISFIEDKTNNLDIWIYKTNPNIKQGIFQLGGNTFEYRYSLKHDCGNKCINLINEIIKG